MFEEAREFYKIVKKDLDDNILGVKGVDLNCSHEEALKVFKEFKKDNLEYILSLDEQSEDFKKWIGIESHLYHWVYSCKALGFLNKVNDSEDFINTGVSALILKESDKKDVFYKYVKDDKVINNLKFNLNKNNYGGCAILEDDDVLIKLIAVHNLKRTKENSAKILIYYIKKEDDLKDIKVLLQAINPELLEGKTFWFEKSDYYTGSNLVIE